jgi:S-disulfanyl-L-cysteine oxidoreductase SoxD
MFNCLREMRGFFERRGREGCAESAEEDRRKMEAVKSFDSAFLRSKSTFSFEFFLLNSISNFFLYFFSAFSAQPSRPLRSKMSSWLPAAVFVLGAPLLAQAQSKFEGIGRTATPAEVKAWDIDVRPDFKGLPKGQGSVQQGEKLWEAQCASCHGSFGESNEVFTPLAGYTTAKDVATGRVASLQMDGGAPTRTSMMKVSQLSTLWDYINRAMPWTAPKSLKPDEVYALTAYLLNLGEVVPADFSLSDTNIAETQKRLPNRAGTTTAHGLWPGKELGGTGKPDVQGSACMVNCKTETTVASLIPDYARGAHGNLADQSRTLGGTRGASTGPKNEVNQPAAQQKIAPEATKSVANPAATNSQAAIASAEVLPVLQKHACIACHAVDTKLVGPSFQDVAAKQGPRADAQAYLSGKIKAGGSGVYGQIPMPAQSISPGDAQLVARWLVQGAKK